MTPEGRDRYVKMLELLIKNLREMTPEQLEPLAIRVEQKRKIPKNHWIKQRALQIFEAEKAAGKSRDDATKAANKAIAHLRLDVKIRDGKIAIEDTGPITFTRAALSAINDRERNAARRKARNRLKTTPR